MLPEASPLVLFGFVLLPVIVAILFVVGVAWAAAATGVPPARATRLAAITALCTIAWLIGTFALAGFGVLRRFDVRPPPVLLIPVAVCVVSAWIAGSRIGTLLVKGLPLATLVGVQAFRFPLELLLHKAYTEGLMPVQMSYSGRNFDIVTGITAGVLALALLRTRVSLWIVVAWNVLGLALLVNIVTVAVLSMPLFRYFGEDAQNVLVLYPPFVWLPMVLVVAALSGHLLIFRKLARLREATADQPMCGRAVR